MDVNNSVSSFRKETPRKRRKRNPKEEAFPIMALPVEIRGCIYNKLPQRNVPDLRIVCKQWASEVDELYEYTVNLWDTPSKLNRIYGLRVRNCTIWKFTATLSTPTLLKHSNFLKILKIAGPVSASNLQTLIANSEFLEQLTVSRRGNFPWILNMIDTPELAKLKYLKYLRLHSEEHIMVRVNPVAYQQKSSINIRQIPLMDCYFPSLEEFQIYKRFHRWNSNTFITYVLNFVGRHHKTLENIELNLTPLSYVCLLSNRNVDSSSEDEGLEGNGNDGHRLPKPADLSEKEVHVKDLCLLKLKKCSVTTQGSPQDLMLWMKIIEFQKDLTELYFHWISNRVADDNKYGGVPWNYFRIPIMNCSEILTSVELVNLSMISGNPVDSPRGIEPLNLDMFKFCRNLKNLTLRCPENHGNPQFELVDQFEDEIHDNEFENILMINGIDLPESVESLEIAYFPMLTGDIEAIVYKCPRLRRLFLKDCGKTGNLGITAEIIYQIAKLEHLKFLEIIGFNDSTVDNKRNLELVCLSIGFPYDSDTWLEFNNGASTAYESLKPIRSLDFLANDSD